MRPLAIALAAALLLPASAAAAPFAELSFQTLAGGASCLRAAGAPGQLVAWAPGGARFLRATSTGLTSESTAELGESGDCPSAAVQPNGAGVAAAPVSGAISVALREPGGAWGAPAKLAVPAQAAVTGMTTAVSERGDAVVAWRELDFHGHHIVTRVRVARRVAGGAFGAAQTLTVNASLPFDSGAQAGVAADGTAIVLFSHSAGTEESFHGIADVAIAAPGAPFGTAQRLTATLGEGLGLAVAGDGRALAAFSDGGRLRIAERAPGGVFGPAQTVGSGDAARLAVALGPGAEAFVAWGSMFDTDVTYARRTGATGFGPPVELVANSFPSADFLFGSNGLSGGSVEDIAGGAGRPRDEAGADLRAAYTAGGRVVLSWGESRARGGLRWDAAHVATVSPDDSYTTQIVSGPLRDAETIAPLVLENGVPAVAWGDNGQLDGRLHLAAEGALAAPAPAPEVRIGKPERSALRRRETLVLPVTCSAACDVRATERNLNASASLTRAGTARLRFTGEGVAAPVRPTRVPVTVLSGAPGARDVTTQVARPRLRRIPDPPMPRIVGLVASRSGSAVEVTWRVDRSARGVEFFVSPEATADGHSQVRTGRIVHGSADRTYRVRFSNLPLRARYVQVRAERNDGHTRQASARVR